MTSMRAILAMGVFLIAAIGVWWISGTPTRNSEGRPRRVSVAAASDLQFAFEELLTAFHDEQPDIHVQATYGSSGNFFAQLSNRAPFDLFLSADVDYPHRLVEAGLADPAGEFVYAIGHLVIWTARESNVDIQQLGVKALIAGPDQKIAIANPRVAPYGRAAVAALKNLGVYEQVQHRFVYGENIAQTVHFVQSGTAPLGIVGLSQARSRALHDRGSYWEIPLDKYPQLEQGGVILSWATDPAACRALRSFLLGDQGRDILHKHGFTFPRD